MLSNTPYQFAWAVFFILLFQNIAFTQVIPDDKVIPLEKLSDYLTDDVKKQLAENGTITTEVLAQYFRQKFAARFFYDYQTFEQRLGDYNKIYGNASKHKSRALDHMGKYADSTQWVLPFNYLNGKAVNAYALRHLARQHKMVDIAFHYFNDQRDPKYIDYFTNQMRSLNSALVQGQYEKIEDGNGVYEVFRAGYRVMTWLWIHNMFLNEQAYSDQDQLQTIATLLQHGAHLFNRNDSFRPGNHQTKGMSSLAMLSILFRDFEGTDQWYSRSMLRLKEHLLQEINADGFQFERSVHYHMSDISNYFYVYQLAKISEIKVEAVWADKLRSLFTTLAKIAYPDKTAPVLQDDTEIPWGEKNEIAAVMTLGYLLFENPEFGYFAADQVNGKSYWFLQKRQLELLADIQQKRPKYGSLAFPNTHYYIMREGWQPNDKMMIISAGLDDEKPDHQHGDMLGVQAIANGQAILPNYQVRYSLADFELFKNSMVKNVALVDDELQGKQWTSNKGGSGFGKFKSLPNPKTITGNSNDDFDLYVGSHDGFDPVGVKYTRQVVYIKDDFWLVKDNFQSAAPHTYKQVWQGHFTEELGPNLIRSTFADASGCDILQLRPIDAVTSGGARGKQWNIAAKKSDGQFDFISVIYPYRGYHNRIDETEEQPTPGDWSINSSDWSVSGKTPVSLTKGTDNYFFGIDSLSLKGLRITSEMSTDLFVALKNNKLTIYLLGDAPRRITVTGATSGKLNEEAVSKENKLQPGDRLIFQTK